MKKLVKKTVKQAVDHETSIAERINYGVGKKGVLKESVAQTVKKLMPTDNKS